MRSRHSYHSRTLRSLIDEHYPGVIWCTSPVGCKKGIAEWSHHEGRVDSWGRVHYDRVDVRVRVDGLYKALRLIALAVNRPMRFEPWWLREYHQTVWANEELATRFRREPRAMWTRRVRRKVRLVKGLRTLNPNVWTWSRYEGDPDYMPHVKRG